jgi:hypothetical protein
VSHRRRQVPKVILYPNPDKSESIDVSPWVQSFSYSKQLGQPMGAWQLTLQPYARDDQRQVRPMTALPDLYRRCRSNGLVSFGVDTLGGIGLGMISNVTEVTRRMGPRVAKGLNLSGNDLGKVLYSDNIVQASLTVEEWEQFNAHIGAVVGPNNTLLQNLKGVWGPTDGARDGAPAFPGRTLQEVITWIIENAPSMTVPILAAKGGSGRPSEFIDTSRSITSWANAIVFSEAPHDYQGTVWGFLESIIDKDVYELWLDTVPKLAFGTASPIPDIVLVMRPKPFGEPALNFLPTDYIGHDWRDLTTLVSGLSDHVIEPDDLFASQLSHGDSDAFAYYLITSQHDVMGNQRLVQDGLMFPIVDTYHLVKHGLRSYTGDLSLVSGDKALKQDGSTGFDPVLANEVATFRNRIFNWYRLNPWFEVGSLSVAGRDSFRAGDPILLPWRTPCFGDEPGTRFYCTAVSHRWSVGEAYTTDLQVTRGHNDSVIRLAKRDIELDAIRRGININHLAEASR